MNTDQAARLRDMSPIAVVGATRGTGELLLTALMAVAGVQVIGIGRNRDRMQEISDACSRRFGRRPEWRRIDIADPAALASALKGAKSVVHSTLPAYVPGLVRAFPEGLARFVCVGSARKFTRFVDQRARDVRAAEAAALNGPVPAVVLHPTMIYGGRGERNVSRILDLVQRFPLLPLPNRGQSLVQPIFCADVVACCLAALTIEDSGLVIPIAGPQPMTYADFVRACAATVGKRVVIVPVPAVLAMAAALASRAVPGLPSVEAAEMRRLLEDKQVDTAPMRQLLKVQSRPFADGLAEIVRRKTDPDAADPQDPQGPLFSAEPPKA